MRKRLLLVLILGGLAALLLLLPGQRAPRTALALSQFEGPVNGGCYAQLPSRCTIHIDAWQPIPISTGQTLLGFQLQANGLPLYNFRTDVSNPPVGAYLPSLVKLDYGVVCGGTYTLTLLAEESGSRGLKTAGSTNSFTCPLLETPTPTPDLLFLPNVQR